MSTDPVVDELDGLRAEQMARFNFDFEAFYRDLKEQEKASAQPLIAAPDAPSRSHLRRMARSAGRR